MLRQQRASKISEDRFPLYQSHGTSDHQGKFKGNGFVDPKGSEYVKGKVRNKDELIKYMANPPGYLQRTERVENFQGKALSFGVLDWERLEKWKHVADGTNGADCTDASSSGLISHSEDTVMDSSSHSSSISTNSAGYGEEKHSSCSSASASHKDKCFREYESASRAKMEEKKWAQWNAYSFDRDYSDLPSTRLQKRLESDQKVGIGVLNFSSDMTNHSVQLRLRENSSATDADNKKRLEEKERLDVNKKTCETTSTLCTSSVNSMKQDVSYRALQKTSFRNNERKTHGRQELDFSHQHQGRKPKNIFLLRPSKYVLRCRLEEHQAYADANMVEKAQNNFSAEFHTGKVHSAELSSGIPRSCPLIFSHQTGPGSETSSEFLCEASKTSEVQYNRQDLEGECSRPSNVEERNQSCVGKSCVWDQQMSKVVSRKGRHPSPHRRFSLSFSQMGRSFSFKESSSLPALSSPPHVSAKSGPLTSNGSAYTDHSTLVRQNGHNRTRSSPLRRILNPILKSKSENLVPSTAASTSSNPSPTVKKSPEIKKQDISTVRALLQFTLRNGIHLFQFVVDNNNNDGVLAATMKNPDSSTQLYTFYSVEEVKKKSSSWLGQGNKEKNHGFAYTIIGHMRLHTSFTSDFTAQKSESVLFDVEANQGDQSIPSGELAAVVHQTHCTTNPSEFHSYEAKKESHSTTIILPGGVHTPPKDGDVLLPLIDRWKSGGTCDCGGWDIGCKIHVLRNHKPSHNSSMASKPHLNNTNSFQFFDQERDRPTFTLVPHEDGFHSVEFDSSVSLIQAFFVSLTVINLQNPCLSCDTRNVSETKAFQETVVVGDDQMRRKTPVKYASNPPVSPVGRV